MNSNALHTSLPKTLPGFFVHFLKPYKRYLAGMVLVSVLWAVHISLVPYVLKLLVDRANTFQGQSSAFIHLMTGPAIGYVALSLALGVIFRFSDYVHMRLMPNLKRDVQQAMFTYLEGHSYTYFQNHFAGALSNKVMDMVRGVAEILQMFMDTCVASVLGISSVLITLWSVNPVFSLIFGIWAVIFLSLSWVFAQKCQPLVTDYAEARSTVSGKLVDSVSNMSNVRLFSRHSFEKRYLLHFTEDVVIKDRKIQFQLILARSVLMLSITTMVGSMIWGLIWARSNALVTAGDFVLVFTLIGRIIDMLWQVTNQFVRFAQEIGTCKQALSIVTQDHQIHDSPGAHALKPTQGSIQFDSVTFRYNNDPVFDRLTLALHGGSKVGLVGFSGSGKTTFVNLILRFFELESGTILIDQQDISLVTQNSLHESIAMIPQDTALFHRSLMDNIRYGRLEATDEDVIEAAKQAHCHEFIQHIPQGYKALVGERGIKLSGGQRQRIAIARAILKNAPLLILDEATSALDSVTEAQIQTSLNTLMQNRTTIVIAHRLSTLAQMDRLLVFDKGKLVQDGTHEVLLAQEGHYQTLWKLQAHGFLPEDERV